MAEYAYRSDPKGVVRQAVAKKRRNAVVAMAFGSVGLALTVFAGLAWGLGGHTFWPLLAFACLLCFSAQSLSVIGGPDLTRWQNPSVEDRYVGRATEVVRTDSDGDEHTHWVHLYLLRRAPFPHEKVPDPLLRQPPAAPGMLVFEKVRVRAGGQHMVKPTTFQNRTVVLAKSADRQVTLVMIPPSGALYRCDRAVFVFGLVDWLRECWD